MRVDAFDFDLPTDRIALRPASPRDSARMLVVKSDGSFEHAHVRDLPNFLHAGDATVFNDTRVVKARLNGRRLGRGDTEPKIEVLLHKRLSGSRFLVFVRPARKLQTGDRLLVGKSLGAAVLSMGEGGEAEVAFDSEGQAFDAALSDQGEMPLPPYIARKRATDEQDDVDYQTIFAQHDGSVAAPTAGLHFTDALLQGLGNAGVAGEFVTLHVGAGTFLPVSADDVSDHKMHSEFAVLSEATAHRLNQVRAGGRAVVAVGTTSLRTLESAAAPDGTLKPFEGETDIFIKPGYKFQAVDVLFTNFHLPRSTLFMLVSAFSGLRTMQAAYAEAISRNYRFYSYGDACLLFRPHDGR